MILSLFLGAYIPYEQAERSAYGEHVRVPLWAAIAGMVGLGLMIAYIRKAQREKRERKWKR